MSFRDRSEHFRFDHNIVTGDDSDAVIDLGYEKNFHNGLSDYDNDILYIPIVHTFS